jgi:hypothetical protein
MVLYVKLEKFSSYLMKAPPLTQSRRSRKKYSSPTREGEEKGEPHQKTAKMKYGMI